ncbi:TPA: hypothetical protein ACH3X3_009967 [Trebouxia sp. C0006]
MSILTVYAALTGHLASYRAQGAASNAKANKVARFLPSPEANWDSKPKHGRPFKAQGKSDATSITFDGDAAANGASNGSCTVTANGTVTHVRQ